MNVTFIQEHGAMWIGADSYSLLEINKDNMKFRERSQLFFSVEDKIIYCFGKTELINFIMTDFMVSFNRSVEELSSIIEGYFYEWEERNPGNLQDGIIEAVVATIESGQTVAYCISPGNNFIPFKTTTEQGQCTVWSVGEKSDEARELAKSLAGAGASINQIFSEIYQSIKSPGIGGVLTVYQIDKYGACLYLRVPIVTDTEINYSARGSDYLC